MLTIYYVIETNIETPYKNVNNEDKCGSFPDILIMMFSVILFSS